MATSSRKPTDKAATDGDTDAGATASDGAPTRSVSVDTAEAHADRVAVVSRTKDGQPDQADGYELIVPDEDKRLAENRPEDRQAES